MSPDPESFGPLYQKPDASRLDTVFGPILLLRMLASFLAGLQIKVAFRSKPLTAAFQSPPSCRLFPPTTRASSFSTTLSGSFVGRPQ